jgi:hypothetical protein
MKAILKFKLTKEKHDFHHALNGWRYADALREIWDKSLELGKNENGQTIFTGAELRDIIREIFSNNNIDRSEL